MKRTSTFTAIVLIAVVCVSCVRADAAEELAPPETKLRVYHVGNSLTRNIPLERLTQLFASAGGSYEYGMQLGGGMRLEQHLVKRSHGGPPGSAEYNLVEKYGPYDRALKTSTFDALILQPYMERLDAEPQWSSRYPYFTTGALQAATGFIDFARGRAKPSDEHADALPANTEHTATERFYIYATWPKAEQVLSRDGEKTYAAYWEAPYAGGVQPCREFFAQLVTRLNERRPDLKTPVRMIPAGEVLAALDKKIRRGELPGIEKFYARVQPYYLKARGPKSPFNPEAFQRDAGVLNLYADNVHMNDQPHNGADSGAIGSYVAALTVYATLSGKSPVGLTVEPYEMFDADADAELIRALQQTVWEVVAGHPHTGVDE
ncbi:MAG: hypothetical protein RIC55_00940 [Pirellulaceae bacterium]